MRRKNILSTAILTALLLTACAKQAPDITDTYQITNTIVPIHTAHEDGNIEIPAKFNPATGSMTPLCSDPLCSHGRDSGCPFVGYDTQSPLYYHNGIFYYNYFAFQDTYERKLMGVDLDTNEVKEIFRYEDDILPYLPEGAELSGGTRGNRFGYHWGWQYYTLNGEEAVFPFRLNLENGELTPREVGSVHPIHRYKKQYLCVNDGEELYTAIYLADDIDGKNKRTVISDTLIGITFDDLLDDDILLYATVDKNEKGYDWEHMTVHTYDLEEETDTVFLEAFPDVYIAAVGDYIYYCLYVENPPFLGYDANGKKDKYNITGGILWRTNIRTGETEEVYALPEYQLSPYEIEAVGPYIIVDYTNIDYHDYTVDSTGKYGDWYNYKETIGKIVYDSTAGTYEIYDFGEKPEVGHTYVSG